MINKEIFVRIRKLAAVKNPDVETPEWDEYNVGQVQKESGSIPIEYEVKGFLMSELQVGRHLNILRTERNGEKVSGVMITSKVTKVTDSGFETCNSVYEMEYLKAEV